MQLMHEQPCDYCGAKPKEACKTKTGRKTRPHADRYYKAREVRDGE